MNLNGGSSADIKIKDGVLKVNHLICLCFRQFLKILRLDIIVRCIEVITLTFEYYSIALFIFIFIISELSIGISIVVDPFDYHGESELTPLAED